MALIEIKTFFDLYVAQGFGGKYLNERDLWEDLGIDVSVILRYICKKRDGET